MTEDRDGINIWLAYCDLFAGMLIVFAAFYGLQRIQLVQERAKNEVLLKIQNEAIDILEQVANDINKDEKDPNKRVKTDGTQLVLPADVTFKFGDYTIREDSKNWLRDIGKQLQKELDKLKDRRIMTIEIRGHTDAYTFRGWGPMSTNWDLSSRRATEIVKFFQENQLLDPTKFHVVAVGAAEFEEYDKNFIESGAIKDPTELESLRNIQIRIVPNYEGLMRNVAIKSPIPVDTHLPASPK